jgi:hypothetical protein
MRPPLTVQEKIHGEREPYYVFSLYDRTGREVAANIRAREEAELIAMLVNRDYEQGPEPLSDTNEVEMQCEPED